MSTTHLAVDFDGVLVCRNASDIRQAAFFKNHGALLTIFKTHYVVPGAIEFLQYVHNIPNVKVAFFSNSDKQRVELLSAKLLELAHLSSQKPTLLSREHLTRRETWDRKTLQEHEKFGLYPGNRVKDLHKLASPEEMSNTILIDDDPSCIAPEQVPNWLYVPSTRGEHFDILLSPESLTQQTRLHHQANRIYYAAGFLMHAIDASRVRGEPITDVLFQAQFTKGETPGTYKLNDNPQSEAFYHKGVALLKQFNPSLALITPPSYKAYLERPIHENDRSLLEEALRNEDQGCCIM